MNPECPVCAATMAELVDVADESKGAAFACEQCGATYFPDEEDKAVTVSDDGVTPLGGTIAAGCPVCAMPLARGTLDKFPGLYCEQCLGVLITNANFAELLHGRRKGKKKSDVDPQPISPDELNRRIVCPNCSNFMDAHPYYGPGNVVIDSCCRCFLIWFDHGEIATIEQA